ncbi:M48 family metallopeptidase [Ferruginivarius sediminum]|uniref:Peptidase M48 domain-containing protein n=1 Tax=Ferruginivarius sediminum TaxID=2661937 RepID=A0A369TFT1_9PROT|nr:M48 family metallopeptidase [Ferruginivarius sediminum]RDD63672.1 hypothetical protein DRB17_00355 [Ferruginivarius sediminum]
MRRRAGQLCLAAALAAVASLSGCKTMEDATETVKSSLDSASETLDASFAEMDKDIQDELDFLEQRIGPSDEYVFGYNWAATFLGAAPLYKPGHPFNDYLQKVGTTVALGSHAPYSYKGLVFAIRNDDGFNAAAFPSGIIMINLGVLQAVHSEDELAAVLAHEIAHHELRHNMLSVAQGKSLTILDALIKDESQDGSDLMETMTLGYNRQHELEADRRGAELLRMAGYDPYALVRVLEALENKKGSLGGRNYPKARPVLLRKHLRFIGADTPADIPDIRNARFQRAVEGFVKPGDEARIAETAEASSQRD